MMKQESYCESMMGEEMHKAMKSRCIGPEMMEDEDTSVIRSMLVNHGQIDRRVKNPKNGVKPRLLPMMQRFQQPYKGMEGN